MTVRFEFNTLATFFVFVVDQVQHIVTETRDKIMQYKSKMVDEADLRRRLANLEESVELHEHMKRQVSQSPLHSQFSFPCIQCEFHCIHYGLLFITSALMASEWSL